MVFIRVTCLWYLCRASWWRFLKVSSHWSHMPFSGLSSCSNFMYLFRWYLCEKDFSHNTHGRFLLFCKSALSFWSSSIFQWWWKSDINIIRLQNWNENQIDLDKTCYSCYSLVVLILFSYTLWMWRVQKPKSYVLCCELFKWEQVIILNPSISSCHWSAIKLGPLFFPAFVKQQNWL